MLVARILWAEWMIDGRFGDEERMERVKKRKGAAFRRWKY